MTAALAADVSDGVHDLEKSFPGQVSSDPDGQGGAYITISEVKLGPHWSLSAAPLSFHLPYNYPAAPPYPFYLPGHVTHTDPWPAALQQASWREQDVLQVSLRHDNWNPSHDTAVGTVLQVRNWLRAA